MGRQRTIFNFSKNTINQLKEYVNIQETQGKMIEMFKDPELAELIESENSIANSILNNICNELKIIGKPDMKYIKDEYKYYKCMNKIKPEYKNFMEQSSNGK